MPTFGVEGGLHRAARRTECDRLHARSLCKKIAAVAVVVRVRSAGETPSSGYLVPIRMAESCTPPPRRRSLAAPTGEGRLIGNWAASYDRLRSSSTAVKDFATVAKHSRSSERVRRCRNPARVSAMGPDCVKRPEVTNRPDFTHKSMCCAARQMSISGITIRDP